MIKQKNIYACTNCGVIFTLSAVTQKTNICPVCKSPRMDKIEGFDYN
ncbi:MAG TPA: hypothetical protein VF016_05190 [Nitrososphaera sp.]|jgi:hypothetical protein